MASFSLVTPSSARPISKVAIIGCGLMGGSLALAACEAGIVPTVYDVDSETMREAAAAGLLTAQSPGEACADADLVILATPVHEIVRMVPMVKPYIPKGALVTDIGSVKSPAKAVVTALDSEDYRVISCHPMAGKAQSGFGAAESSLFRECTNLLFGDVEDIDVRRLANFFTRLGVGRNLAGPLDVNDVATAVVSHFPQVAVSLLAKVAGEAEHELMPGAFAIAGPGWRDSTRVAESSFSMWGPIIEANAVLLAAMLTHLAEQAAGLADSLQRGDLAPFEELFTAANTTRQRYRDAQTAMVSPLPSFVKPVVSGDRWECDFADALVWTDTSLGYTTVRTSAPQPAEHARLAAGYVANLLGLDAKAAYDATLQGKANNELVVDAIGTLGVSLEERKTWTADGLMAHGVVIDGQFLVIA